jgi:hypothetical protein
MANDEILRERINSVLRTVFAGGSSDAFDLARQFGLPTFSEFEAAIAPLLKRVTENERKTLLEALYIVTAQKIMKESGRSGMKYMMTDLRKRRMQLGQVRAHIKNARQSVSAAQATFPRKLPTSFKFEGIIKRLSDFEADLAAREHGLAALVDPQFKTKTEKIIPPPEPSGKPLPWTNDKSIKWWFIEALNKCLPRQRVGKRSRFARDEVIQKVLKISGDTVSIRSIIRARERRSTAPKSAKKK